MIGRIFRSQAIGEVSRCCTVRPIQCLTCSSWQPGLDGRTYAEQDTPFQELSDDTSSTAASSQLTPTRVNLVCFQDEIEDMGTKAIANLTLLISSIIIPIIMAFQRVLYQCTL